MRIVRGLVPVAVAGGLVFGGVAAPAGAVGVVDAGRGGFAAAAAKPKVPSLSVSRAIARAGKKLVFRAVIVPPEEGQKVSRADIVLEKRDGVKGSKIRWRQVAKKRATVVEKKDGFHVKLTRQVKSRGIYRAQAIVQLTAPPPPEEPPTEPPAEPPPDVPPGPPINPPGPDPLEPLEPTPSPGAMTPAGLGEAGDFEGVEGRGGAGGVGGRAGRAMRVVSLAGVAKPQVKAPKPIKTRYASFQIVGRKVVALTFDDGPGHQDTAAFLGILAKYNVRATFFTMGEMLARKTTLAYAKRAVAEGHQIAIHRWDHRVPSTEMSDAAFAKQVDDCIAIIKKKLKVTATAFRFPWGISTAAHRKIVNERNLDVWDWHYGPGDGGIHGPLSPDITGMIADGIISHARDGAVLLLHDSPRHPNTLAAMPRILATLTARGFDFVTCDDLLALGYRLP
ncbi:MAG: polysaccharide deacetylase family protein [Micrococcales bacterium]|nr:polysaccharide deacetylase family protein [Micrococcales bacterium]